MVEDRLAERYKDAPFASVKLSITLGGAGGLGSWVALFLARQGHKITIHDFDEVEDVNIGGGQWYREDQIGQQKTSALLRNIRDFTGTNDHSAVGRFDEGSNVHNVCIATFDNMEARKLMLEKWFERVIEQKKAKQEGVYIFLDGRMFAEGGHVYAVDRPQRYKRYLEEWEPSSEIEDLPCSFKATTSNCAAVASIITQTLNNKIVNKIVGGEMREVPYFQSFEPTLYAHVKPEWIIE